MRSTILYLLGVLLIVAGLFALSFTLVNYRRYETETQHWEDEADYWYNRLLVYQQSISNNGGEAEASLRYNNAVHNATIADAKADQCIWGFAGSIFIMASGLAVILFIWKYEKEKEINELLSLNELNKET